MSLKKFSRRWYQSLQVQVLLLFMALGGILALTSRIVFSTQAVQEFTRYERERLLLSGESLISDFGQHIEAVEATARAIALLGAQGQMNTGELSRMIPNLLDAGDSTIVAGGGLWPEPYTTNPTREKSSLFWGRDNQGRLVFYDDYNEPGAAPYFHEEWYVPATYLNAGQAYWSRSYIDPYSREPMATCTVPYFRAGRVAGVATVDITLIGLKSYLESRCDRKGMYMFAVDHANHFLDYPQLDLIQPAAADSTSTVLRFITVDRLADAAPAFRAMADTLESLVCADVARQEKLHAKALPRLTWELNQRIPDLAPGEARIIAAKLLAEPQDQGPGRQTSDHQVFEFSSDPLFNEASTTIVIPVPRTGWKVVAVTPATFVQTRVARLAKEICQPLLAALLVIILLSAFSMRYFFFGRINRLITILQGQYDDLDDELGHMVTRNANEVGELAFWFANSARALRASQQRAEVAARTKGTFLANMSHEIRTPMNGILGAANLLEEPDDPLEREKVDIIRRSAESLLTILNDILDLSKMEAGQFSVANSPFDLVGTIESCQRLVENLAAEKHLALRFENRLGDCPSLLGDAGRLRQILLNLLSNAIKFTSVGSVTIVLDEKPGGTPTPGHKAVRIEVRDTGVGIAAADQEKVFQVFEQVDATLVRQAGGTGLGLAISRHLSHLMGGDLTVHSSLGEGSVFRLDLCPAWAPQETESRVPVATDDVGLNIDVLLVEDNPTNRLVALRFLEKMGCRVSVACDGEEGVAVATETDFDIIIMDLQMPRMDGLTASTHIRQLAGERGQVPIIALTANAMSEDRDRCLAVGMNDFLTKPLNPGVLRRALTRFTEATPTRS